MCRLAIHFFDLSVPPALGNLAISAGCGIIVLSSADPRTLADPRRVALGHRLGELARFLSGHRLSIEGRVFVPGDALHDECQLESGCELHSSHRCEQERKRARESVWTERYVCRWLHMCMCICICTCIYKMNCRAGRGMGGGH